MTFNPKYIHREKYNEQRINSKCEVCKRTFYLLQIHHIDKNRENNIRSNLMFICQKCHVKIHYGGFIKDTARTRSRLLFQEYSPEIRKFNCLLKSSQQAKEGL